MQSLVLFFNEGPIALGPIGQRMLELLGGLDTNKPEKWGRFGLGICEDYIGYPVRSPANLSASQLFEFVEKEARTLGLTPVRPEQDNKESILFAVNQTVRAISGANGQPLHASEYTAMDGWEGETADMMFLAVLNSLADGTAVQNYSIRCSTAIQ